jgi:zinc protease
MTPRVLLALVVAACGGAPSAPARSIPTASALPAASPASTAPAQAPAAKVSAQRVRSVEGITEYRLPNGLQVLMFPDETQSTITVNVTYLVGSRHEGYGETGMAHLLEHMMFKGTPRHRNVLKLLGERGGQANGTTWLDRTNYYETLPASPQNLEWTLDLESDRMRNASISPEDLSSEFSVVRNEFESGENDPEAILDERVVSTAFLWHNYGKSTIGSRADIERVPVPALRAFYDRYYQPDNAVLVVSGKFDDAAALAAIERLFGAIGKPARTLLATYTVEPVQDGEREVTLRRTGDVHVIALAYHTVAGTSDDFPAVEAAIDVLTREPSGSLYKRLVETKLASSLSGSNEPTHDPYVAQFSASVRDPKQLAKVRGILTSTIERLGSGGIDDKSVERWRVSTLKELELAMADSQRIAVDLSEFAALGDWRTLFAYRQRVEKVTTADVVRVAKTYFKASNRTSGTFIPTAAPDRAPLTETPDVAVYVKGIEGGDSRASRGEAFAATLENIEQRTTRTELAGGISAALLPKKTRGGKVELELRLHWGDETSLQNKATAASLVGDLMARGTAKKSYQDLQDAEDALKAKIWIDTSSDGMTLHIETLHDKLPGAVALAFEMLTAPSFPANALEIVREEQLASLEERQQDPMSAAWNTLEQLMSKWPKGDPRYPRSVAERIAATKKVTLGEIKKFYKDFVGAGHGELSVVGDFDAAALTSQIETLAKPWQTKKPYARLVEKVWKQPAATKAIDLKDKEMTTIALSHDVAMKDTDADYPAWLLLAQVLGGDAGSRMWMRLREKEGLSYGVGAWGYADSFDGVGGIGGYAIVAPQNVAKAKASLLEEVDRMLTGTVTEQELQRAKDNWLKDLDTSLSSDSFVADMLANQTFRKRTTEFTRGLKTKLQAVTAADIARVAKAYLDPKRLILVEAGDAAKAAKPAPAK